MKISGELNRTTTSNIAIVQDKTTISHQYILLTTTNVIKIVKDNNYFPEFKLMKEFVTPDDDEYYKCLAIKINKQILSKKPTSDPMETCVIKNMYSILNSVNLFLDYPEYNNYLTTHIISNEALDIDKVMIYLHDFVTKSTEKTKKNESYILLSDFLKSFYEYLDTFENSAIVYKDNKYESMIEQYLVFHHDVKIRFDYKSLKTINLKINKIGLPDFGHQKLNYTNKLSMFSGRLPLQFSNDSVDNRSTEEQIGAYQYGYEV